MSVPHPDLTEIYRARNSAEASAIHIALEDAGIPSHIDGEMLQGALGEMVLGWSAAPRILVEESRAQEARELINRLQPQTTRPADEDESDDDSRCLACGHELKEDSARCPNCGWSYQGQDESSDSDSS